MKEFIKQFTSTKSTGLFVNIFLFLVVVLLCYSIYQKISSPNKTYVDQPPLNTDNLSNVNNSSKIFSPWQTKSTDYTSYNVISEKVLFSKRRALPPKNDAPIEETTSTIAESPPDINLVGILVSNQFKRAYIREQGKDKAYGPGEKIGGSSYVLKDIFLEKIVISPENSDKEIDIYLKRYAGNNKITSRSGYKKMYVKGIHSTNNIYIKEINGKYKPFTYFTSRGKKFPRYLETINSHVYYEEVDGKMLPFTDMVINKQKIKIRVTEVPPTAFENVHQGSSRGDNPGNNRGGMRGQNSQSRSYTSSQDSPTGSSGKESGEGSSGKK